MTTYYVDGSNPTNGNGSAGNPWKTLALAHAGCSAGDTVRVKAGTYYEQLTITKANTTWIADSPAVKPVVDGRYHVGLMSGGNTLTKQSTMPRRDASSQFLPAGTNDKQGLIQLNAPGVTVDGFVAQNSTGSGINLNDSDGTVQNCVTYWTYASGIMSNAGRNVSGLRVLNNVVRFASIKTFDPARKSGYGKDCRGQCVDGSMKFGKNVGDTIIRGNDVAYGFGEGINIGKDDRTTISSPILVELNVVHDICHSYLYANDARGVIFRRNICYCTNVALNLWDGDAPVGIRLYDELTDGGVQNVQVYNNLVVNLGYAFHWGGRHTYAAGVYVGYNTFVGGPQADVKGIEGVELVQSDGGISQRGIFENNIIDYSMCGMPVLLLRNIVGGDGITLRNNNWSRQPAGGSGDGDRVGVPRLVNPGAGLSVTNYITRANTTWASVTTSDNFNIDNYKLTNNSPARGASSNGSAASGVTPPTATNVDLLGAGRDAAAADRDMGALEYGGTTPPTDAVHAGINAPGSTTPADAPRTVNFIDASTVEGAAVINHWFWDFGDGTTGTAEDPTHVYSNPGSYTVSHSVGDTVLDIFDTIVKVEPVVVTEPPDVDPVIAAFTVDKTQGLGPLEVQFTDLSGGPVVNWGWDFGDGGTSTVQSPAHVYADAGSYTVSLTVDDGAGGSDTETAVEFIVVLGPPDDKNVPDLIIIGPLLSRDRDSATSVTYWDASGVMGAGADAGHVDIATGAARPVIRLRESAEEPSAEADRFLIFIQGGVLKVKLPNGTVKVVDWT